MKRKGRPPGRPSRISRLTSAASGGGEIRTPVLHAIFRNVYARIPVIGVSARWPLGNPRTDESAIVSSSDRRPAREPAQICDTCVSPRAGYLTGTATASPKTYAARAKLLFAVNISRVFYQEPEDLGAQLRSHSHNRNRSPPHYKLNIPGVANWFQCEDGRWQMGDGRWEMGDGSSPRTAVTHHSQLTTHHAVSSEQLSRLHPIPPIPLRRIQRLIGPLEHLVALP